MNFFDYLLYLPYKFTWAVLNLFRKRREVVFYCEDPLDYYMFLSIKKHLDIQVTYVSNNKKTDLFFARENIPSRRYPVFPGAVIMARQAAFRFPVAKIKKIGFDHGLYQFKRWTSSRYYNSFDVYFVSSEQQVWNAEKLGIRTTRAIGYPKLDKAFDGSVSLEDLQKTKDSLGLNPVKKTIIFSSTWNVDRLSALDRWIDRIDELTDEYNVLITVHTWTRTSLMEKLKQVPNAFFLDTFDVTEYLMIADVFIGDYNSLIGEFCALDKPIITFRLAESPRAIPEVKQLISEISIQIDTFDEIKTAIIDCIEHPGKKAKQRALANRTFYLALDGNAGKRAAEMINQLVIQ